MNRFTLEDLRILRNMKIRIDRVDFTNATRYESIRKAVRENRETFGIDECSLCGRPHKNGGCLLL